MTPEQLREWYVGAQVAANIRPGSRVRVTCAVPNLHNGWNNSWTDSMNRAVGNIYTVGDYGMDRPDGVPLRGTTCLFPFYVLEVVEEAPVQEQAPRAVSGWELVPDVLTAYIQSEAGVPEEAPYAAPTTTSARYWDEIARARAAVLEAAARIERSVGITETDADFDSEYAHFMAEHHEYITGQEGGNT